MFPDYSADLTSMRAPVSTLQSRGAPGPPVTTDVPSRVNATEQPWIPEMMRPSRRAISASTR